MEKIGLFYGSDSGNTQKVAEKIAQKLQNVEIFDVAKANKEELKGFKNLILATPTYGSGDIQGDWEDFLSSLKEEDFDGKVVALVGLGDQDTYSDTFCNGLYEIYKLLKNAKIIGQTSTKGYEYEDSDSVVDGKFVGLILDEDNQEDLTEQRIQEWCEEIKGQFV